MQSQSMWHFFLQTGLPAFYVLYKELGRAETARRPE